jgi:hypothetical protein
MSAAADLAYAHAVQLTEEMVERYVDPRVAVLVLVTAAAKIHGKYFSASTDAGWVGLCADGLRAVRRGEEQAGEDA